MPNIIVILFILAALFLLSTSVQGDTQLGLPEGAKARLGKDHITGNITYSPDGTRLAMASSIEIWIYDAHTGEELTLLTGHVGWVLSVSFSPDGATLASGSWDGTVRLWDANAGEHLRTLTGHTGLVTSVSFSPEGATLASGSWDGTVRLWDANTGEHLRTLTGHTVWLLACRSVQTVLPLPVGVGRAPCCSGNTPPTPTEEVNGDNVLNPYCERIWEYNSTIFPIACGLSPLLYLLPLFHPIPYSVNR